MRTPLHLLHSVNGGFVDTLGFVTLHGLFAAHVTGNIVTLAADYVTGTHQPIAKLLALPVYCVAVVITRTVSFPIAQRSERAHLRFLLALQVALLGCVAMLAVNWGPFPEADAPIAVATGLVMVVAMSIQNVVRRLHMPSAPPTTVMTGTITQLMMDVVDALRHRQPGQASTSAKRAMMMARGVAGFAAGAALSVIAVRSVGEWAYAVPPLIAAGAFVIGTREPATD